MYMTAAQIARSHVAVPIVGSLLIFSAFKFALLALPSMLGEHAISLSVTPLIIAGLLLTRMRATDMAPAIRVMTRGIAILFAFYAVAAPISVPAEALHSIGLPAWVFHDGRWLVPAVAAVSWARPSWGLLILAHVWAGKAGFSAIAGLQVSKTDWMVVWEAGVFLILSTWVAKRWRMHFKLEEKDRWRAEEWAVLVVLAVHFANYLYSGLAKLALGPRPWTWLIENPTDVLMITSWQMGLLPLAVSTDLATSIYGVAHAAPILINAGTLAGQLIVPFAIARIIWQRWLTAYFDLQHVAIFFLTGIFFWKWIVFNALLIVALGRVRFARMNVRSASTLIAVTVCSPLLFHVVYLAWYDTRVLNDARLIAVTVDGRDIAFATNAALSGSVTFTQSRSGAPFKGAAPTDSLGATWDPARMRAYKHCDDHDFMAGQMWTQQRPRPNVEALDRILRGTMGFIGEQPFYRRDFAHTHLYAHHVFSNPWLYPDMKGLRLDDVVAVDFAVTTRCSYMGPSGPDSITLADGRWRILDGDDMKLLR